MKNSILTLFILLSVLILHAQDYTISFSGSGASALVESVNIENLTQGKSIVLSGSEVLHLKAIVTANNPSLEYIDYPMHVYPNPSNGYCTIEFGARKSGSATIKVFDTVGREIAKFQQTLSDGIHSVQVSGLGNGIYTVNVSLDDRSYSSKIISNSKSGTRFAITYLGNNGSLQAISKLKGATVERFWQYNTGDRLKFIGTSGRYSTVVMDIPTSSKTLPFNFIECTDADGNNYPIVQIGTQIWMAENLKTTKYNDGKSIPNVTDFAIWSGLSTDAYCWYNNDVNYKNTYGALYNWYAINTTKLAPVGWHVATDAEWTTLSNYLGGNSVSGGKLKETGTIHWTAQNSGATNETGFTALPGGQRDFQGTNSFISRDADWWSSTANSSIEAWSRNITFLGGGTGIYSVNKRSGYSVRCILGTSYLPSVTTTSVTNITKTSAAIGVNVTSDGGEAISASGVCWSTSPNPTVANSKITGNGTGAFVNIINGLNEGTVYYVRAYATNSAGTAYGEELSFTTFSQPVIITFAATNITQTTATSGGNITNDGGATIIVRGVCWSTYQNPTTENSITRDGTGTGNFTSNLTGLTANTKYYVRAYLGNNLAEIYYGNEVSFTTGQIANLPILSTTTATNVTRTTATSGGNISSDGDSPVTARGICWSTSQNPTTGNSKTSDGTGIGSFTSNLTGLTAGTTYYARAYATNSAGTAYGNQVSFATSDGGGGNCTTGTFTDPRDGHVYKTIKIGTQTWMAENLAYLPYTTPTDSDTEPCYYVYDYNEYGVLYNWPAAMTASPAGWHLPSDAEWTTLSDYLINNGYAFGGSGNDIAKALASSTGWNSSSYAGDIGNDPSSNNNSCFSALPGGEYIHNYGLYGAGRICRWWSSTASSNYGSWNRGLIYDDTWLERLDIPRRYGFSVRCVKDL